MISYVGDDDHDHMCFVWANDKDEVERMLQDRHRSLRDMPFKDLLVSHIPRKHGAVSLKEAVSKAWLYTDFEGHLEEMRKHGRIDP